MLSAFTNSLKIPELRQKIFFTLALLFIARVGANIPLPGMNPGPIQEYLSNEAGAGGGLLGLYNMFTGGALLNGALFALGIMPYISASIIMQLMGVVVEKKFIPTCCTTAFRYQSARFSLGKSDGV